MTLNGHLTSAELLSDPVQPDFADWFKCFRVYVAVGVTQTAKHEVWQFASGGTLFKYLYRFVYLLILFKPGMNTRPTVVKCSTCL